MHLLMIFGFMVHRCFPFFFFFFNSHYFIMACEVSMLATQSVTLKMGCVKVTEGDEKEKQYTKLFFSF